MVDIFFMMLKLVVVLVIATIGCAFVRTLVKRDNFKRKGK